MKMSESTNMLAGAVSVLAAIRGGHRDILKIFIDRERLNKVKSTKFRAAEKMQYAQLLRYADKNSVTVEYRPPEFFHSLSNTCGGIAAEVTERKYMSPEFLCNKPVPFFVYLTGIEDPFNFGYALRSLYLSGCDGVFLPPRNFFGAADVVVRSSAGASELIDIAISHDDDDLVSMMKENSIRIVCTSKDGAAAAEPGVLTKPLLLVIGGEKRGISASFSRHADVSVRIDYAVKSEIALPASSAACLLSFAVMAANR